MNKHKLFMKALNNPKSIRFQDLRALLEAYGFRLVRVTGSHHIFGHDLVRQRINLQPSGNMAKPYQVRQVLQLIEEHELHVEEEDA